MWPDSRTSVTIISTIMTRWTLTTVPRLNCSAGRGARLFSWILRGEPTSRTKSHCRAQRSLPRPPRPRSPTRRTPATRPAAVPVVQPAADWNLVLEEEAATHTRIRLTHRDGRTLCTRVPLFGGYMAANAALAIVMVLEAGYSFDALATALARDGGIDAYIPGRTELI